MLKKQELLTIGYAGHSLSTFVQSLQTHRVTALLDIRMTPLSRKRGFSKSALREALENAGIKYFHFRTLGSPKELRVRLNQSKDYNAFFKDYENYLNEQMPSLNEAAQLAQIHNLCLMCVEVHPDECHRSIVAKAIAHALQNNVVVDHLSN